MKLSGHCHEGPTSVEMSPSFKDPSLLLHSAWRTLCSPLMFYSCIPLIVRSKRLVTVPLYAHFEGDRPLATSRSQSRRITDADSALPSIFMSELDRDYLASLAFPKSNDCGLLMPDQYLTAPVIKRESMDDQTSFTRTARDQSEKVESILPCESWTILLFVMLTLTDIPNSKFRVDELSDTIFDRLMELIRFDYEESSKLLDDLAARVQEEADCVRDMECKVLLDVSGQKYAPCKRILCEFHGLQGSTS